VRLPAQPPLKPVLNIVPPEFGPGLTKDVPKSAAGTGNHCGIGGDNQGRRSFAGVRLLCDQFTNAVVLEPHNFQQPLTNLSIVGQAFKPWFFRICGRLNHKLFGREIGAQQFSPPR
jgi:hypothetical protein